MVDKSTQSGSGMGTFARRMGRLFARTADEAPAPPAGPATKETPEAAEHSRYDLMLKSLGDDSYDATRMVAALAQRSRRPEDLMVAKPLEAALARAHMTGNFADYRARCAAARATFERSLAAIGT